MSTTALTLLVALSATAQQPAPPHRYVVSVGFNASSNPTRSPLRYADDDAARMFEVLAPGASQAHLLVRFDGDSAETFTHLRDRVAPPTREALEAALAEVRRGILDDATQGLKSELFFYFAGHGDQEDGLGYVNLADGRLYRPDFLKIVVGTPRADQTHVIVDACKSYFIVAGRGPGGAREPHSEPFAGPEPIDGVGYVLSTSTDSEVHEWSAFGGGIFTHEVRSALVGAADADMNGIVEYSELEAFIRAANESIPYPRYRPNVFVRAPPGQHRPALFTQPTEGSWLRFEPESGGRVHILDQRGLRYADLHKARGAPLRIRLIEPFRYEVRVGDRAHSVQADGREVELASLEIQPITLAARSESHRAFTHLFSTPFSVDVVRGFRLASDRAPSERLVATAPPGPDRLGWALIGGGAAAVVTGVVLGGWALERRAPAVDVSQLERASRLQTSDRLAIAAATVGGLGVGALLTELGRHLFTPAPAQP